MLIITQDNATAINADGLESVEMVIAPHHESGALTYSPTVRAVGKSGRWYRLGVYATKERGQKVFDTLHGMMCAGVTVYRMPEE